MIINDFKLANITMLLRVLRNMVDSSDKTWSTGEGNGKPFQYSYRENPINSMKRQKDRTLKDDLPRSVGAQYTTGDQWRNNSRKNEEMEPKQKQCPVLDVTGERRRRRQWHPHSSTLAWKIPWTEEPGRLKSMGSQRVG